MNAWRAASRDDSSLAAEGCRSQPAFIVAEDSR
jgi:hypothetical protein